MVKRIEDYALIGDCESGALVGSDGSIDWLCWPRFDSGAVFAALLGKPDNGFWSVTAADAKARTSRQYLDHSSILETQFQTASGAVSLTDFMPFRSQGSSHLVRLIRGRRGKVTMRTEFAIRFDYGSIVPWVTRQADNSLRAVAGPDMAVLRTAVAMKPKGRMHRAEFAVRADEIVPFVLSYGPSYRDAPETIDPEEALKATLAAWETWAKQGVRCGQYSEAVFRSLVTLKTLTYRADRRHCRRPDDVFAGDAGRAAQLGLPLLLAARRYLHVACLHELRFLARGRRLAPVAAARRGR